MMKNILKGILLLGIVVVGSVFLVFSPYHAQKLQFGKESIRIERDAYGIPHIYAPSRRSYLYAMGNLMAEDRLFQIHFRQIYGQGRLSEYLGELTLKVDIFMRDLGLDHLAKHVADRL